MKPHADIAMPLAHENATPSTRESNRANEARRTRADNRHLVAYIFTGESRVRVWCADRGLGGWPIVSGPGPREGWLSVGHDHFASG
ncbi:hypothetical protein GCM10011349_12840 [Novosphingobium indicum]|uniref:Uncharacterized protein n=1 Tax=Novosphingobium indicum TaxID=462949 RepID=A0ABQ2JGP3_9SPHN|nr:hypothetical protein GCM10011349_12840 [Novosphingobium indicum]